MHLARGIAKAFGPGLVAASIQRAAEREAEERKQHKARAHQFATIEAARVRAERMAAEIAKIEDARLTKLEEEARLLFGADWRPQIFASTRGWIDVNGKPATQEMIDLHHRLKARDG